MTRRRDPAAYAHPTDYFREPSELDAIEDYTPTPRDHDDAAATEGALLDALARAVEETRRDRNRGDRR